MICNSGGFWPIKRKTYSSLACVATWENLGSNVCETAPRSLVVLAPNGLNELPPGDLWRDCGGLGKEILMPYSINQSWREQIELNWIGGRVGLWDAALKFLSPGPRNDVTDHLEVRAKNKAFSAVS